MIGQSDTKATPPALLMQFNCNCACLRVVLRYCCIDTGVLEFETREVKIILRSWNLLHPHHISPCISPKLRHTMSYNVRFYESVWFFAVVRSRSNPTLASFYFGYLQSWFFEFHPGKCPLCTGKVRSLRMVTFQHLESTTKLGWHVCRSITISWTENDLNATNDA